MAVDWSDQVKKVEKTLLINQYNFYIAKVTFIFYKRKYYCIENHGFYLKYEYYTRSKIISWTFTI